MKLCPAILLAVYHHRYVQLLRLIIDDTYYIELFFNIGTVNRICCLHRLPDKFMNKFQEIRRNKLKHRRIIVKKFCSFVINDRNFSYPLKFC